MPKNLSNIDKSKKIKYFLISFVDLFGVLRSKLVPAQAIKEMQKNGADVAKALALGADAVSIGSAAMIAIGDNDPKWEKEYEKLGTKAGAYDDWHEGNDPAGISTQKPELMKRLDPKKAGRKLSNYLKVMSLEAQTIARACGKNSLHNLEPEDLCALTVEAAAMARVPLAGTSWIPGIKK